jgi:hypothetical protein
MFQIMVKCQKRYIQSQKRVFIFVIINRRTNFPRPENNVNQDVSNITVKVSNADDIGSCVYRDFKK